MWVCSKYFSVLDFLPSLVAKLIPVIIILLLLAIAAYYGFINYLEQRRRKDVQLIIQRYKHSQATRLIYLNITSHYINSPIAAMQGALQLMKKDGQLPEEVTIATEIHLDKLAKSTQKLSANAHEMTSVQMRNFKQIESLKILSIISDPVILLPIIIVIALASLVNFIFIQADKYLVNIINIGAQIVLAIVGIVALLTFYYIYRKTRNNVQVLSSQLELEKNYTNQQINFIQQVYNELNEYITALGMVSKPIIILPRGSIFKEGLDRLYHSITVLSKLQLLAHQVSGLTWKTDVNEITKQALKGIRQLSDKAGIGIVVNIDPYLVANIDETSLYHLIESTLDNAIKFSEMGSQVLLSIRSVNSGIMITVQDHGQGISKELMNNLMLPFTRNSIERFEYDGLGLDLYLCRLILEHYNGKLVITSEPQKGTTVQMLLSSS